MCIGPKEPPMTLEYLKYKVDTLAAYVVDIQKCLERKIEAEKKVCPKSPCGEHHFITKHDEPVSVMPIRCKHCDVEKHP